MPPKRYRSPLPPPAESDTGSSLSDSPSLADEFPDQATNLRPPQPSTPRRSILPSTPKAPRKRGVRSAQVSYQEESDTDGDVGPAKRIDARNKLRYAESPTPRHRKRKQTSPQFRGGKRAKRRHEIADKTDSDIELEVLSLRDGEVIVKEALAGSNTLSPFEKLPGEIVQEIATLLPTDADLKNLSATSHRFSECIHPQNSPVWATRFTNTYDQPQVQTVQQFCAAYKLRRMVLRYFIDFSNAVDLRLPPQLAVLHDMVLEAFRAAKPHLPPPKTSQNLALFADPASRWMTAFISSPTFNHGRSKHGKPHTLFDTLQLAFSYLLLSPTSTIASTTLFVRDDYDIAKVYNWNVPFSTLFSRLPDITDSPFQSSIFPNLRSPSPFTKSVKQFNLDTHTLLHIRNFWHRHLIKDCMTNRMTDDLPEETFQLAASKLAELGHVPSAWTGPLTDPDKNLESILRGKWVGFYSCLHPWPANTKKGREDMIEQQSAASGWDGDVCPLTLDFRASTSNKEGEAVIWPDLFNNIECFNSTIPTAQEAAELASAGVGRTYYLRGIAPFTDIDEAIKEKRAKDEAAKKRFSSTPTNDQPNDTTTRPSRAGKSPPGGSLRPTPTDTPSPQPATDTNTNTTNNPPKEPRFHPFTSLRLRGVIHPLPWTHPSSPSPANTFPSSSTTTNSSSPPTLLPIKLTPPLPLPSFHRIILLLYAPSLPSLIRQLEHSLSTYGNPFGVSVSAQISADTAAQILAAIASGSPDALPDEAIEHLRTHLKGLLAEKTAELQQQGRNWGREEVEEVEKGYYRDGGVGWEDVEFGYAYEGMVGPGGRVMLGRWWRAGEGGVGVGRGAEVDYEGVGVPDGGGDGWELGLGGLGQGGGDDDGDGGGGGAGGLGGNAGGGNAPGNGNGNGGGNAAGNGGENAGAGGTAQRLERGPFVFWPMGDDYQSWSYRR